MWATPAAQADGYSGPVPGYSGPLPGTPLTPEHAAVGAIFHGAICDTAKPVNTCGCGALSAKPVHGPYLRCMGYQADRRVVTYSGLLVAKGSAVPARPLLRWSDPQGGAGSAEGYCLDR